MAFRGIQKQQFLGSVRPLKRGDSRRIWEIRNHPLIRNVSEDSREISFENHTKWFENKYFSNGDNYCFVLESERNDVIGYCRFDKAEEESVYIISIALDPLFHGKGFGSNLLKETLRHFSSNKRILATVQKGNPASFRIFEKCGFSKVKEDGKNYYFELNRYEA